MCVRSLNLQVMGLGCEPTPASKLTVSLSNICGLIMKIRKKERRKGGGWEETTIYT